MQYGGPAPAQPVSTRVRVPIRPNGSGEQPDRGVDPVHPAAQFGGAVGVEPGAGGWQSDADPLGESGGDLAEGGGVRGPHISVAQGAGQGGQGFGEMADVGVECGTVGEGAHHHGQRVGQFGEEAVLGKRGDLG